MRRDVRGDAAEENVVSKPEVFGIELEGEEPAAHGEQIHCRTIVDNMRSIFRDRFNRRSGPYSFVPSDVARRGVHGSEEKLDGMFWCIVRQDMCVPVVECRNGDETVSEGLKRALDVV